MVVAKRQISLWTDKEKGAFMEAYKVCSFPRQCMNVAKSASRISLAQIKAVIMPTLAYCADVWPGLGSPGRSSAQQDAYPDKELLPELQGQSE